MRLVSFALKVLLTTAIAPAPLTASFRINKPCWLPLKPNAGSAVPGTIEGDANVSPPSLEYVNPSPRG